MDKVKKFLEAYVQWLAVALGVGFLGWTVYGYVVQKPVTVPVGPNQDVTPADVAGKIWSEVGEPLQTQIKSTGAPPPSSNDTLVESTLLPFNAPPHWPAWPTPWTPIPVPDGQDVTIPKIAEQKGMKINKLPEAPAPIDIQISRGHSNVPGPQAPGVAGGGAPAVNAQAVDKNWISVEGTLHVADLAKSFKAAGIEPGSTFSSTCVLRVELIRQQMNVDGSWGPETEIPPLDINPLPPLPDMMVDFSTQKDYFDFAEKNVVPIVQPPFYQVLQGNVWYEPGTKDPNEAATAVEDAFDPKDPGAYAGDPNKLLPSERKLFEDAKARQAAKDAAKARSQNHNPTPGNNINQPPTDLPGLPGAPGPGGGSGGTGRSGRSGRSYMAADPQRPADDRNMMMPPGPPGTAGFPYGGPPGMQGGLPGSNGGTLPAGSFDPSVQADFKMWAHDPSVQAGKTYRYKLRYVISNPVARTSNMCDPADLSKQFYIVSKDSAWTESVNVESDTNFYAVELKHGVRFDVFKWKDGVWQMQSVTDNPGDMVGSVETNPATGLKTDFTTGWTLVDIREDPNNNDNRTLVLVSDNGTVIKKDLLTDAHGGDYRKLYFQANANKPAAAAAGAPPNPTQ